MNSILTDLATGISAAVAKNGENAFTGQMKAANGTVSAPGITFGSDLNLGLYRIGADNLGVAANGAKVLDVATTGLSITGTLTPSGQIVGSAGTKTAPSYSFVGDLDNGIYYIGSNNWGLSAGDTLIVSVETTGITVTGAVVADDVTVNDDLVVTDDASVGGDLDVTGDVGGATATLTGNVTIGGTLAITGATTATAAVTAPNIAKAFANFTCATTTVTFNASTQGFNVATIAHSGVTGIFDVAFTNSLPTANYTVVGVGKNQGSGQGIIVRATDKTTAGFKLNTIVSSADLGAIENAASVEFVVFGF